MTEPRAYTPDEVRDQLIEHVWTMIRYWGGHDGSNVAADRPKDDCLSGLAHSILVMLDGCAMDLPAFKLQVDPHPEDEAYLREQGENFYPVGLVIEDMLHEHLYRDDLRRDER